MKTLLINFLFLSTLLCFGQSTKITIDLTDLEIGDIPNGFILIIHEGYGSKLGDDKIFITNVENLPTFVELEIRDNNKIITQKYIWVEDTLTKVIGSAESPQSIMILPESKQQTITDQITDYINKNKKLKDDLAYTRPYLIHLANKVRSYDNSYLKEIVNNISPDLKDFWAVNDLKQYLADYENTGFNPKNNQLLYLTVVNKDNKREKIEFQGDKYTLLDFSLSGCIPCLKGIDELVDIYKHNNEKIDIVTIWSDRNYNVWINIAKEQKAKITWKSYLDENHAISKSMDINIFPTYILIDKNGIIIKKWKGRFPDLEKYLVNN